MSLLELHTTPCCLSVVLMVLFVPQALCMHALGDAAYHASSVQQPSAGRAQDDGAGWQQSMTLHGDLRAALGINERENRDGIEETDILPAARLRGGATLAPVSWLAATARLAGFFDEEMQGLGFRFAHRRTISSGDVTFDSMFLTLTPHERFTVRGGRLQTAFELDSVVQDSLSRHDSSGLGVDWTDGIHMMVGRSSTWRLHVIGQANPEEGPTNGVGSRGPLDFADTASRITYYVGVEAPAFQPFTQLMVDLTVIPQALRPFGVESDTKEDVVALTMRAAADLPLSHIKPVVLHLAGEFGVMASTPRENVLKVSNSQARADRFAFVAALDLKHVGPGDLGMQFAWTQAGFLLSPDYPNNTWSLETRYKVGIWNNTVFEVRYRHREDIERLIDARARQTEDNILARITVKF